ncbi:MAG: hypothetical protein JF888_12400 [Candidatus Dormibacteraeota bacterium]|uniref:Uncharacterized protein n=1 Tax=Candidatus Dormiibacter inghamiae TaxID=3127013 RepID=A0A934KI35_9BACT|nr:hypothetical protein [Candidatus Dormibacteraeota bacterium]MBJ7604765.1 hypothetical protein [Candidatus Dormibacteraeota bacterium]
MNSPLIGVALVGFVYLVGIAQPLVGLGLLTAGLFVRLRTPGSGGRFIVAGLSILLLLPSSGALLGLCLLLLPSGNGSLDGAYAVLSLLAGAALLIVVAALLLHRRERGFRAHAVGVSGPGQIAVGVRNWRIEQVLLVIGLFLLATSVVAAGLLTFLAVSFLYSLKHFSFF